MTKDKPCPECGNQVDIEQKVCEKCGHKFDPDTVKSDNGDEESFIDKTKESIKINYTKTREKLSEISHQIKVNTNNFIFTVNRRIDRWRVERKYKRMKKEKEMELKKQQEDEITASQKAEIDKWEEEKKTEKESVAPEIDEHEEIDFSEDLKDELDKLDQEKESEAYLEKLTSNPFKLFPIIQSFVALIFLGAAGYLTLYVSNTFIIEDVSIVLSLILLSIIIGITIWVYVFNRYYDKFIYFLVEQKWTRKIVAGGAFSFFEYKNPLEESMGRKVTEPIGMTISSTITMLALATTIVGLVRKVLPDLDLTDVVVWSVITLFVPILATLIVPIIWALEDAKVKAYNPKNNTNWLVSSKYKRRFNSIISVTAILSNLSSDSYASFDLIFEQLQILFGILQVGLFVVLTMVAGLLMIYYLGFRGYLRRVTLENLNLGTYEIKLIELDKKQFELEQIEEEEEIEDESDNETTEETQEEISVKATQEIENAKSQGSIIDSEDISEVAPEDTVEETSEKLSGDSFDELDNMEHETQDKVNDESIKEEVGESEDTVTEPNNRNKSDETSDDNQNNM